MIYDSCRTKTSSYLSSYLQQKLYALIKSETNKMHASLELIEWSQQFFCRKLCKEFKTSLLVVHCSVPMNVCWIRIYRIQHVSSVLWCPVFKFSLFVERINRLNWHWVRYKFLPAWHRRREKWAFIKAIGKWSAQNVVYKRESRGSPFENGIKYIFILMCLIQRAYCRYWALCKNVKRKNITRENTPVNCQVQ